jgi:hypothetical protein
MNRRELLQGALAVAASVACSTAAFADDPLVFGIRYISKCPDIYEYYTTGSIMGHPWGTKRPLSKLVAALVKHKDFADKNGWGFTWEVIP